MTSDAPGWDAIDARLAVFYPDVEPQHFGTLLKYALGGPDPLDGVSFYTRSQPVPHWHIVSYGMSELYTKKSGNADDSGWGFEFTLRIARRAEETKPPIWAANLLQNLARYVYSSGNWFEPGHHMNANGPICRDHPTDLTAVAFAEDPELGTIDTPHGRVQFLQVVGLTGDEYAAARRWNTDGVLDLLRARVPLLVTDLDRPSITGDPEVRAAIEAGRERDGSATGLLMIGGFGWSVEGEAVRLRFKAVTSAMVAEAIRDRLPHGRPLLLDGEGTRVVLTGAQTYAVRRPDENVLELDLPAEAIDALPGLLVPGIHAVAATRELTVEVIEE